MSPNPVKCQNCGAMLMQNEEKSVLFCPFCGAELPKEEGAYDYSKFVLKHNEEVRQRMVEEEKKSDRRQWLIFLAIFAAFGLAIYFGVVHPHNIRVAKLEATLQEVYTDINEGRYDEAMVKVQSIRVEKEGWFDERYSRWENQRKDLIRLIEQKQRESN